MLMIVLPLVNVNSSAAFGASRWFSCLGAQGLLNELNGIFLVGFDCQFVIDVTLIEIPFPLETVVIPWGCHRMVNILFR